MSPVEVTRTYLQMTTPAALRAATDRSLEVRVECAAECPASFYRYLYREVGGQYHWVDRLGWSEAQVRAHLADDRVSVWVMYRRGSPAGYFELRRHDDDSVEIAYFGLLPEFIGRGLGGMLLTAAVQRAWELAPCRVWLHTCTLDHPAAMANYLKRGFVPYKEETYWADMERGTGRADEPLA